MFLMRFISILLFALILQMSFSQESKKENRNINLRYGQNVHTLSFAPSFLFSNISAETIWAFGAQIGYSYFPVKNWSIGTNVYYARYFIQPKSNRVHDFSFNFATKYFIRTKKNLSFFVGLNGGMTYFNYKTYLENPNFIFYNDPIDSEIHEHWIPVAMGQAGLSFKIMKNFSIQLGVIYNHSFYKLKGKGKNLINPITRYCSINYHFFRGKKKNSLKKIVKY